MVTGKNILVIEDEFLVAADIMALMEGAGAADVQYASTEEEALSMIEERDWDAAVADANLCGRNILQIASSLRRKGVPFIIVSGYARESLPRELRDIRLIGKPFRAPQLLDAVGSLCEN